MAANFSIKATVRNDEGKGASRRLRHAGQVPAVIYGGHKDPLSIQVKHSDLVKCLENEAFYSHVLTIELPTGNEQGVLKAMQRPPYKPVVMHFDIQRVVAGEAITVHVPLHFTNEATAPGVKLKGGKISHLLNQVEVSCVPADLPEFIEVDCGALEVNDIVHLSNLKLPKGVTLTALKHGDDATVLTLHVPGGVADDEEEAPAA